MDFTSAVLGPVFEAFGVAATLSPASGGSHSITALDRTRGMEIESFEVGVATVYPVARVRASDLADLSVLVSDLPDGSITLNGTTWAIDYPIERPSPSGAADGVVDLVLVKS